MRTRQAIRKRVAALRCIRFDPAVVDACLRVFRRDAFSFDVASSNKLLSAAMVCSIGIDVLEEPITPEFGRRRNGSAEQGRQLDGA